MQIGGGPLLNIASGIDHNNTLLSSPPRNEVHINNYDLINENNKLWSLILSADILTQMNKASFLFNCYGL